MARTWLIGEHNPYGPDQHYALYPHPPGCAGWRMMRFLKLTEVEYLDRFERRNLLTTAKWSAPRARQAAEALRAQLDPGDRLVLLGAKVSAAFGLDFQQHLCAPVVPALQFKKSRPCAKVPTLVLPHPSGLSRAWNEPGMAARVRAALAALEVGDVLVEGVDEPLIAGEPTH